MARLLKPGFHSGTLPKRYAKLRRAERHARAGGNWRAVHKHLRASRPCRVGYSPLCRTRVSRTVRSKAGAGRPPPVILEQIRLGTNSVQLSLGCPDGGHGPSARRDRFAVGLARGRHRPAPVGSIGCCRTSARCSSPRSSDFTRRRESIWFASKSRASFRRRRRGTTFPPKACRLARPTQQDVEVFYNPRRRPVDRPAKRSRAAAAADADGRALAVCFQPCRALGPLGRSMELRPAGRGHPRDPIVPVQVLPTV